MKARDYQWECVDAREITDELFFRLLSWEEETRELAADLLHQNPEQSPGARPVASILLAAADTIAASDAAPVRRAQPGAASSRCSVPFSVPGWLYWPARVLGLVDDLWQRARRRN